MKIELSKPITLKTLEFIGEVNFFEESPYMELLKGISTEQELKEVLEDKGLSRSAIKNIVEKLDDLGVMQSGDIVNIENGFPAREYGKYSLEIFENNTRLPFKYKNRELKRESYKFQNIADRIEKDEYLLDKVYKKSKNFSDNKEFQVIKIEADAYSEITSSSKDLKIILSDNQWGYILDKQKIKMDAISYYDLFRGQWNEELNALHVEFSQIENKDKFITSFEASYRNTIEISDYGELKGKFQNIPIMPMSVEDANEWLLYLLKQDIEKKDRYISKDELRSLWLDIFESKAPLNYFNLSFDFEKVLEKFGKDSKYYWLLKASIDLYPFDTALTPKDRVIIARKSNMNLENDFVQKFNMSMPKELIVVDRWIVNLKHFKALDKILITFKNPKITIITQSMNERNSQNIEEIQEIIKRNNIQIIEKPKREIVHSRYWIFNNKSFYKTNNSLDVIKIDEGNIEMKEQTTFDLYDEKDLEVELKTLVEGTNV